MEDLPRNIGRHSGPTSSATKGQKKQWTLLLVEHQGKVISLGHIRGVIIIIALIWIVIIATVIFMYYQYYMAMQRIDTLDKALAASEQEIVPIRNEKDILMARLVVAEEKIEMLQSKNQKSPAVNPDKISKIPKQTPVTSDAAINDETVKQIKKQRVEVKEFEISFLPETSSLEAKFRLNNTDKEAGSVSGFIFVVLKKQEGDDRDSITLPKVPLVSGKPQILGRGRYFVISRFNIIRLKTVVQLDPEQYPYATILIFSKNGTPLLEKDFPVQIKNKSNEP